jgi:hypothetical protein
MTAKSAEFGSMSHAERQSKKRNVWKPSMSAGK